MSGRVKARCAATEGELDEVTFTRLRAGRVREEHEDAWSWLPGGPWRCGACCRCVAAAALRVWSGACRRFPCSIDRRPLLCYSFARRAEEHDAAGCVLEHRFHISAEDGSSSARAAFCSEYEELRVRLVCSLEDRCRGCCGAHRMCLVVDTVSVEDGAGPV